MEIQNSEIEYAGKLLLNDENAFYDDIEAKTGERSTVIRTNASKHILACPGSGKTTTLLAKLIILGNRMDFSKGRGVCVFTHTNVAIDKIKKELGSKSDVLFSYPNYFGTIQSFVNKFLAIPSYIEKKGFRPTIRDDYYYDAVKRKFDSGYLNSIMSYIDGRTMHSQRPKYAFVGDLRFFYGDREIISKELLSDQPFVGDGNSYRRIKNFKQAIYDDGFLCYDDAYMEAREFLTNHPKIANAIRNRFEYVFVDEMQDSGGHQLDILDKLFYNQPNLIYQCFGDVNQAIYSNGKNEGQWSPPPSESMLIGQTKRFSNSICTSINELRINKVNESPNITSGSLHLSKTSTLIIFSDNNVGFVIDKYAELIKLSNIPRERGCYAIGRIAKPPSGGQFCIRSYFGDFERSGSSDRKFDSIEEHIFHARNSSIAIKDRYTILVNALLTLLEINGLKNNDINRKYSKNTLFEHLQNYSDDKLIELKGTISAWIKSSLKESITIQSNKSEIVDYFRSLIYEVWNKEIDLNSSFIIDTYTESEEAEDNNVKTCVFEDGDTIDVIVNTINGEKGRTHSSTLYLETYFNKTWDVEKMLPYMAGEGIPRYIRAPKTGEINLSSAQQLTVKFGYVGMSRAQHLLCVAVRASAVDDNLKQRLLGYGWDVNEDLVE